MLNTSKPWLALSLIAALALLAGGAVFAAQSPAAYSGGFSSTGPTGGDTERGSTARSATYERLWRGFSQRDRRWANRTSECESGRNPRAIGGGGRYRGAFQFMKATWKASPRSPGGDPISYSYRTQAVVAVLLKNRDGAGHWPVCG